MNTAVVIVVVVASLGCMYGLYKLVQGKNESPKTKPPKDLKDLPGDEPKDRP